MEKNPLFYIEKTGLQTTFQDLGRHGYQQFGVVVSGAMDPFALQVGNLLVGNKRDEAGLEVTMVGPELVACSNVVIAICGASLHPKVNGHDAPMWKSFELTKRDRLTFGTPKNGLRAYITVAGGFDIPVVMGSKSTFEAAGLGKTIEKGDTLYGVEASDKSGIGLVHSEIPKYEKEVELRVVVGPHEDHFTKEGFKTFFNETHTVSQEANRMGVRLESSPIKHKYGADIWSDAIPFGGVQVPANGQAILLMADRQTTGGYTRIGTVISVDLPKVGQLPPGGKIRFREVDVVEGQELYGKRESVFEKMAMRVGSTKRGI